MCIHIVQRERERERERNRKGERERARERERDRERESAGEREREKERQKQYNTVWGIVGYSNTYGYLLTSKKRVPVFLMRHIPPRNQPQVTTPTSAQSRSFLNHSFLSLDSLSGFLCSLPEFLALLHHGETVMQRSSRRLPRVATARPNLLCGCVAVRNLAFVRLYKTVKLYGNTHGCAITEVLFLYSSVKGAS